MGRCNVAEKASSTIARLPRQIREPAQCNVKIAEIIRKRNVMAIWLKDVIEAAAKHDLAGLGADRVEVPRTDAFAVDSRPFLPAKNRR